MVIPPHIIERAAKEKPFSPKQAAILTIDPLVEKAAQELGHSAASYLTAAIDDIVDKIRKEQEKQEYLSDIAHVNQHR